MLLLLGNLSEDRSAQLTYGRRIGHIILTNAALRKEQQGHFGQEP